MVVLPWTLRTQMSGQCCGKGIAKLQPLVRAIRIKRVESRLWKELILRWESLGLGFALWSLLGFWAPSFIPEIEEVLTFHMFIVKQSQFSDMLSILDRIYAIRNVLFPSSLRSRQWWYLGRGDLSPTRQQHVEVLEIIHSRHSSIARVG